jgi:CRP-like cAMP-binding protein
MQVLRNYIDQQTRSTISDANFALVTAELLPYKLRKGEHLLQAGEVCQYFAFVVQGALCFYTLDAKGSKRIHELGIENRWLGDRESWSQLTPSPYYIDAVEDSQLLLITCPQAQELVRRVPLVGELVRIQDEQNAFESQKRLHAALSCPAEERYAVFVAQHPDYLHRFSQLMIASYLGISPEALSRIQTKLLQV